MSPWWSLIELSNPLHVPIRPCFLVPPLDPEHVSSQSKSGMWSFPPIRGNPYACMPLRPQSTLKVLWVKLCQVAKSIYVQVTRVLVWAYSLLGRVRKSEMGPWDEQQQATTATATTTTTTTTTTATITKTATITRTERERETPETKGLRSEGVHLPYLRHGFRPTILK